MAWFPQAMMERVECKFNHAISSSLTYIACDITYDPH